MRPHLCQQRGGAIKKGCAACARLYARRQRARSATVQNYRERNKDRLAAYWRQHRATHREQQRVYERRYKAKLRKVKPLSLMKRVEAVLSLGITVSIYDLHPMLGCPHMPTLVATCFKLQRRGVAKHERTKTTGRGAAYKAIYWSRA